MTSHRHFGNDGKENDRSRSDNCTDDGIFIYIPRRDGKLAADRVLCHSLGRAYYPERSVSCETIQGPPYQERSVSCENLLRPPYPERSVSCEILAGDSQDEKDDFYSNRGSPYQYKDADYDNYDCGPHDYSMSYASPYRSMPDIQRTENNRNQCDDLTCMEHKPKCKNKRDNIRVTTQILPLKECKSSKIIRFTIENLKEIPTSGTLYISTELPKSLHDIPCGTYTSVATDNLNSSGASSSDITENCCVCRNPPEDSRRTAIQHLQVMNEYAMRPRSNSENSINFIRRGHLKVTRSKTVQPNDIAQDRKNLPEIKVEDFSDRRRKLKKQLENESADLRKDLDDNAEFFSQVNYHRRRSNTCPGKVFGKRVISLIKSNKNTEW